MRPASPVIADRFDKNALQTRVVLPQVAEPGCVDHFTLCVASPYEPMASRESQFANKLALRSAVSFAERMNGVDFPKKVCRAMSPRWRGQIPELFFSREFGKELVEIRPQIFRRRKDRARLGDIHRTQFSSPFVNIAKHVPMNGAQVLGVKVPANRVALQFEQAPQSERSLDPLQIREIGYTEFVGWRRVFVGMVSMRHAFHDRRQ